MQNKIKDKFFVDNFNSDSITFSFVLIIDERF